MTVIATERFRLRPIRTDDAPRFAELCNDVDIARNTARIPHPYTLKHAQDFVEYVMAAFASGQEYAFAVWDVDEIVACAGTMPTAPKTFEIGYWVGAAYRGHGVATEAARAVTCFSFDVLGAETVTAGFFADNPASGRVLEKAGFKSTGERIKTMSVGRDCEVETVRLALHAEEFLCSSAAGLDRAS